MHFILFLVVIFGLFWIWPVIFSDTPSTIPTDSSLTQLSEVEQQYYQQIFDYTMTVTKPGESYSWKSAENSGAISVSKSFSSKSGATCRVFTERYIIGGSEGSAEGIGCKREGRDGWCRLKKGDALTCSMEKPAGLLDRASRGSQDVVESSKGVWGEIKGWWR